MSAAVDYITALPRETQFVKGKIRTFSGKYVNPLALQPEDICIEDIAHHLSLICRYVGACPFHFSVAQHSLMVSAFMSMNYLNSEDRRQAALAGLMHDASEAYLNDISSPVKHSFAMADYRKAEDVAEQVIFGWLGLGHDWLAATKTADDAAFFVEVRSWWGESMGAIPERPWRDVEREFIQRYKELTK